MGRYILLIYLLTYM